MDCISDPFSSSISPIAQIYSHREVAELVAQLGYLWVPCTDFVNAWTNAVNQERCTPLLEMSLQEMSLQTRRALPYPYRSHASPFEAPAMGPADNLLEGFLTDGPLIMTTP
jgi:hypothetical protein